MKIKTLMIITAVITLLFGLAFLFIPEKFIELYGDTVSAPMKYIGQLFGAALIGFAVLTWSEVVERANNRCIDIECVCVGKDQLIFSCFTRRIWSAWDKWMLFIHRNVDRCPIRLGG